MSKIIVSGDRIRELREECNFSQESIAKFLGVDQSFISKVEHNERVMTSDMLEKLAPLLGVRVPDFFEGSKGKPLICAFRADNINDSDMNAISAVKTIALNGLFLSELLGETVKSTGKDISTEKVDLLKKSQKLRKDIGEDENSAINILQMVFSIKNLTLIFYPMGENVSGMCVKNGKNNFIAINSDKTVGRQNYSIAHELYHIYFDSNMSSICFMNNQKNDIERAADQFASYFLIPPISLEENVERLNAEYGKIGIDQVVWLEQYFMVSRQAMLNRLVDEGFISKNEADEMRTNVIASATSRGYMPDLYRPLPQKKKYCVYGHYIEQVNNAVEKNLISNGKCDELLLQAYRPDIVYGTTGGDIFD